MHKILLLTALTSALVAPTVGHAATLNFDFSFTGDALYGNTTGTVTGEIFGLTDNATSSPTDIVIDSYPPALTGLPAAPWDIFTVPGFVYGNSGLEHNFTVSAGVITSAAFGELTATDVTILDLGYGGLAVMQNATGIEDVANLTSAIIFTPDTSTVPEPASIALLLSALFGVGAIRRFR